jgi:hypothetical protein
MINELGDHRLNILKQLAMNNEYQHLQLLAVRVLGNALSGSSLVVA